MMQPGAEQLTQRSPRVVAARKLLQRKHRNAQGKFLAEGPQAVREALRRHRDGAGASDRFTSGRSQELVSELFLTLQAGARYDELRDEAIALGVRVSYVTQEGVAALADTVTPQGLIAVCSFLDVPLAALSAPKLVIVVAEISDPGNAGTILRVADAAGADVVVFPNDSVDPYNGKCVRASAGSLFHPAIVRGGVSAEIVAQLREAHLQVLATSGQGDSALFELAEQGELAAPTAWVFGNEAHGLSGELMALTDRQVSIPIYGGAESLNLATAAAVCLYASAQAQRI